MRRHFVCHSQHLGRLVFFLLLTLIPQSFAAQNPAQSAPVPEPVLRIDLAAAGYLEPSRMERLAEDQRNLSLDFVDQNHVLLAFNQRKLMKRLPGCTPDHQDRLVHALILELPSGKVVTEAEWYLHDRRRYLWPLAPGQFLLRKLNSLYVVDSNLHEKLLLESPKDLLWVSVTPDGAQIILERENDTKAADPSRRSSKPDPKYVVQFLDVKNLAPQRTLLFNNLTNLTGTSSGYSDVIRKGDIWLLRFGPNVKQRLNLARVRSQTVPYVMYPTENTVMIGRCATAACSYGVTAFTLSGRRLWRQHWPSLRSYPEVTRSQDHSRFGVSTLRVEPVSAPPKLDTEDDPFQQKFSERDVFRQEVQVFDTASGNPVLSLTVSPAMTTGQNVSLSPDGRRLALLRGSALELFDLPAMSEEEQAKYAALKADVPGLYALGAGAEPEPATGNSAAPSDSADAAPLTADATATTLEEQKKAESQATVEAESKTQPPPATPSPNTPASNDKGEKAEATTSPVPTIRVTTRAVVVDVVVTDNKGHPIRGLQQQDFQLAEDNKAQGIRYFREYENQDDALGLTSSGASPSAESVSAATATGTPSPAPPPSPNIFNNRVSKSQEGGVTLVLFDMLNTAPQDQAYARQQLIKFLQSKPKLSQLALCTLAPGEHPLRLIQGFTADETVLLAVAKGKKVHPREDRWQANAREVQNSVSTVTDLALAGGRESGFQNLASVLQDMQAGEFVRDTSERAARTLDGMMLLGQYLSGISGRKNIVWLSGSFPIALSLGPLSRDPSIDNPNFTYKIKRVTNLLADSQVAVYPVDVRGLQVFASGAENPFGSSGAVAGAAGPIGPGSQAPPPGISQGMMDFANLAAEQDTLTQFAVATGGKAFFNTNDIREAIATANEQGTNYYSLSYSSTNNVYDGKFRKIKVQLARKGYTLHYRQGYFADDVNVRGREAELARRAVATAMHYGSPPAREVQFAVRVYPVGGKKKVDRATIGEVKMASRKAQALPPQVDAQHYVIDYSIPGSELRFAPQQSGTFRNSLALLITSFGPEGRMLTGATNRAASELKPELYRSIITQDVGFEQEVDIPVEAISMRLGIQDQMSNHLGTVDVALPVPPDPTAPRRVKNKLPEIEPD